MALFSHEFMIGENERVVCSHYSGTDRVDEQVRSYHPSGGDIYIPPKNRSMSGCRLGLKYHATRCLDAEKQTLVETSSDGMANLNVCRNCGIIGHWTLKCPLPPVQNRRAHPF